MLVTVRVRPALQKNRIMISDGYIDKKDFEDSKKLDMLYVLELVKEIRNDTELGAEVRKYVLFNQKK